MNISVSSLRARAASQLAYGIACLTLFAASSLAVAQKPEARILAPIDNGVRTTLTGSKPAIIQASRDAGAVDPSMPLQGLTFNFSLSPSQQTALDALIAAQQNPASPQYHQWLSPDQFAAQFGAADADIAKAQVWLTQQGFAVGEVSRNRLSITFSGTVAQVNTAFGTQLHYFNVGNEKHFAPANDLSIPAAFASAVSGVGHLTDFRPRPHLRKGAAHVQANFTTSNGVNFLTPGDVAVIYDINAAYTQGYTGSGQTIAVVGQSEIYPTDITNFQNLAGIPARAPNMIPLNGTGAFTYSSGDETESDLDLEYVSSIAKGATIDFVYTGNNVNYGTFYALEYAITNKLAPIISNSYGLCEPALGSADYSSLNTTLAQGAAQGQTIITAAGDDGSSDCYEETGEGLSQSVQAGLAVDFPASSQYVTGLGGTEFPLADISIQSATGTLLTGANAANYWSPANGTSDITTTALKYIPETAWNDDLGGSEGQIASGGGGISTFTPRPSWQTGVAGISGSFRLVPDIALDASPANAPYLICSSDTAFWGFQGCASGYGFRSAPSGGYQYFDAIGGTSAAAPIFAGMMAIINQAKGASYSGIAAQTLYSLASNSTTYASAFHDVTTGTNECAVGVTYPLSYNSSGTAATYGPACSSAAAGSYAAGTGYDEATGLGSVDLYNLLSAWPAAVQLTGTTTTVTPASSTPGLGAADIITFKVASASSTVTTTPTGSIALSIDGTYIQSLTLSGGTATYTFSSTVLSAHTISAVYSGDTNFSTSTGTQTVTVIPSTLKATTTTVTGTTPAVIGVAEPVTITVVGVTPAAPAPTGTVTLTVDGGTAVNLNLTPGTNSSTASYTFSSTVAGTHVISAMYNSDANYQTSIGTLSIIAAAPGTFTLAAPALSVSAGNTGTETITVTPVTGFTGTVNFSLTTTNPIVNACYTVSSASVTGATAATATATIYTGASNCPGGASALFRGAHATATPPMLPGKPLPLGIALAGLIAIGFAGRRSRKLRGLIAVALLAIAGMAMSGCGSSDTSGAGISSNAPSGTYTVTVTGTDAATGTKTATTTFSLTIQ